MPDLKPCGTYAAYQRHFQNGEPIDDACREANNTYCAKWRKKHGYDRARHRALALLRERHADEFAALLAAERANQNGAQL